VETFQKVLDPFGKAGHDKLDADVPLIELDKRNTQKDNDEQHEAFNLNGSWYGFSEGEPGDDINEDRQGHDQQKSKADGIGRTTHHADEFFQSRCYRI